MGRPGILAGICACLIAAAGCGGGSSSTSPPPPPSPDFSIALQPTTLSIVPGTSTQIKVTSKALNGFNGTIAVESSTLPAGVTTNPSLPQNIGPSGLDLTLIVAGNAQAGNYSPQFVGSSGSLQHSATESLNIGPRADFSLFIPPGKVNVAQAGNASADITVNVTAGIVDYTVQLQATVTNPGVTATFANPTIVPPTFAVLTLTASPTAATGPGTVNVQATRSVDGSTVSLSFPIYVDPQPGTIPGNRTSWLRTGSNPIASYYDAPRNRVLVSLPALNLLDVVDPTAGTIVSSIPVSLAGNEPNGVWLASSSNLSSSLDGKSLYALGLGYISTVDLASAQVVAYRPLPMAIPIGWSTPDFIHPAFVVAAAGGRFVMGTWGDSVFYNWDGSSALASLHLLSDVYSFDRNFNGTKVLIASGDTSGAYELLDVASDTITRQGAYSDATVMTVRGNPVRNEWAVANSNGIDFLDANLNLVARVPAFLAGSLTYWGMTYSTDGKYLYFVYSPGGLPFLITVDATAHSVVQIAPATGTDIAYYTRSPPEFIGQPTSADATGMVFSLGEKGLVMDDATYGIDPTQSTPADFAIIATPDSGLVNAATPIDILTQSYAAQPDVWFGAQRAQAESMNNGGQVSATAPPGTAPGPVNIKLFPPDGYAHVMPQAFTYGTVITSVRNSVCSFSGGCSADIFGFGLFGANTSQTTVTIGGHTAPVQSIHYFNTDTPYPYPLQYLTVTVPAGTAGHADVAVNTASGNASLADGFLYAKSVHSYPSAQRYNALLYDRGRRVLYASTDTQVARYSLTSGTFLSPITPPTLSGTSQFLGMALTPDGSRLLVADKLDVSVAVVDPDNPSNATAVPVPVAPNTSGPMFVATTSTGRAFVSMTTLGTFPYVGPLFDMDLTALQITADTDPIVSTVQDQLALSATSDGTMIVVGLGLMWNATTNTFTPYGIGAPWGMTAASGDGDVFTGGLALVDRQLNSRVGLGMPDEISLAFKFSLQADAALNDSGSLWFVPYGNNLAIIDAWHGSVLRHVSLANQMNIWTKVIAVDDTAQHVFLSDFQGLTVYEFVEAPLAIGSVTPSTISSSGSTVVKVRGSGFSAGTTVTIGGNTAAATLVDANTLDVTTPAHPIGAAQMVLRNSDGETYSLDAAVTYH